MRLYVAGAYADRDRVLRVMAMATEAGHEVVHDWVAIIDEVSAGHDRLVPDGEARRHAIDDIEAIRRADVFWLLAPPAGHGRGCWVETGIAYAQELPIVVSGEACRDSVFTALGWRFEDDADALRMLDDVERMESGAFA